MNPIIKTRKNPAVIMATILFVTPVIGWAATASIREARSEVYSMGIVPYYVYGYDVKINPAAVIKAVKIPAAAPLLPMVGGGGAAKIQLRNNKTF